MKKLHKEFIKFLGIVFSVVLATNVSAQNPTGNQIQINPAVLEQMKKASPKKPIAFTFDKNLKTTSVKTADGFVTSLLPPTDMTLARENLQRMLMLPEQQAARKAIPLMLNDKRPPVVANLAAQTRVQQQGGRGTCGVFSAVAALEAAYKRAFNRNYDFSEQHVNWLKNVVWLASGDHPEDVSQQNAAMFENLPGALSAGVSCVGILQMLTRYSAVEEIANPYIETDMYEKFDVGWIYRNSELRNFLARAPQFPQKPINEWNFAPEQMPEAARLNPQYGVREVVALTPEEFRRPEVIESLVASGKDIVFALQLYKATAEPNPRDPVWRRTPGGEPGGGHCMTIVGYDRNRRFFIVKNSWGEFTRDAAALDPQWRDVAGLYDNYELLDYDYLNDIYEAGYINSIKPPAINFEQRMLGLWDVTIKQKSTNRIIRSGTLAWRQKAPYANENGAPHHQLRSRSFRIGDFTDSENRSYRVNGELVNVQKLNLYIAFDHPNMPYTERGGIKIEGIWRGRNFGKQTIEQGVLSPTGFGSEIGTALGIHNLDGIPLSDLEFTAKLR